MDQGEPLARTSNDQTVGQQQGSGPAPYVNLQAVSSSNTLNHSGMQQPAEPFPPMRRSVSGIHATSFPAWTLPSITPAPNSTPVFASFPTPTLLPWSSAPPIFRQTSRESQERQQSMTMGEPWSCNAPVAVDASYTSQPYQIPNECFGALPGGGFGGADYSHPTTAQNAPYTNTNTTNWNSQHNPRSLKAFNSLPSNLSNTSLPAISCGVFDNPAPCSIPVQSPVQRNVRAKQRSQEHQLEAQLQAKLSELSLLQAQSNALQKKL